MAPWAVGWAKKRASASRPAAYAVISRLAVSSQGAPWQGQFQSHSQARPDVSMITLSRRRSQWITESARTAAGRRDSIKANSPSGTLAKTPPGSPRSAWAPPESPTRAPAPPGSLPGPVTGGGTAPDATRPHQHRSLWAILSRRGRRSARRAGVGTARSPAATAQASSVAARSAGCHGRVGIRPAMGSKPSAYQSPISSCQRSRGAGTPAGNAALISASVRYELAMVGWVTADTALTNSVRSRVETTAANPLVKPPPADVATSTVPPTRRSIAARTGGGRSTHEGRCAVASYETGGRLGMSGIVSHPPAYLAA